MSNIFIFIGGAVLLLMIGMFFIQSRRIALLSRRLDYLTQGADGLSLEEVLASHLETVVHVANGLDEVAARTAMLEGQGRLHFGRLGLVRFNPFDVSETGGNQSFALAMLDANNDGFVISSLHSRTATRIYAKAIFEGVCETSLSTEEEKAVGIAVSQGGPAAAADAAEPAPNPVRKPARQRPAVGVSRATSTSSLGKPGRAPRTGQKAGSPRKPAARAQAAAAEAEATGVAEEPGA